ncbi:MAG: hypothetical protein R2737_09885 [Candidatus Nanopelagicales bacterium]
MSDESRQQRVAPHGSTGGLSGRAVAVAAIVVVLVVFLVQNLQSSSVQFLWLDFSLPTWLLVLIVFALGVLLGGLVRGGLRKLAGRDEPGKK